MDEMRLRLGEILVDAGVLQQEQLDQALAMQKARGIRLGQVLLQENFISEPQLVQALSRRLSIPWVSLEYVDIPEEILQLVPPNVAEEFFLIPVYVQKVDPKNKTLFVAMNDPMDETALRFVSAAAGMPVKPMVAGPSDISTAIQYYYYGQEDAQYQQAPLTRSSSIPAPLWAGAGEAKEAPEAELQRSGVPESAPIEDPLSLEELTDQPIPIEELTDSTMPLADHDIVVEGNIDSETPEADGEMRSQAEEKERQQHLQREVEKHMFGVGPSRTRGRSLTLLDGTTIRFGGANQRQPSSRSKYSIEDLAKGLKAHSAGLHTEFPLPSDNWEDYFTALLSILVRKNLVFFDELMRELKKKR